MLSAGKVMEPVQSVHDKPVHRETRKACGYKLHQLRMLSAGKVMEPVQSVHDKPVHRKARKAYGYRPHLLAHDKPVY
jgi:hypothetical protein